MKYFYSLLVVGVLLVACQHELDFEPVDGGTEVDPGCRLVKIITGTGVRDSTFFISYDSLYRITNVVDSMAGDRDSLNATLDPETGLVKSVYDAVEDEYFLYTYDSLGRLVTARRPTPGMRFEFEYNDQDQPVRELYYNKANGSEELYRVFTYTFDSEGDLLLAKELSADETQVLDSMLFVNTTIPNPLKSLVPFCFSNSLGLDVLYPTVPYLYMGDHLVASVTFKSGYTYSMSYITDGDNRPIRSETLGKRGNGDTAAIYTNRFFYECQ